MGCVSTPGRACLSCELPDCVCDYHDKITKEEATMLDAVGKIRINDSNCDLPFYKERLSGNLVAIIERRRRVEAPPPKKKPRSRRGRRSRVVPENFDTLAALYREGKISGREGARLTGMPRSSFIYTVKVRG